MFIRGRIPLFLIGIIGIGIGTFETLARQLLLIALFYEAPECQAQLVAHADGIGVHVEVLTGRHRSEVGAEHKCTIKIYPPRSRRQPVHAACLTTFVHIFLLLMMAIVLKASYAMEPVDYLNVNLRQSFRQSPQI